MPDLHDLLRDAAPRPEAELDVRTIRARVQQRSRRRRALVGGGVVVALLAVGAAAAAVAVTDREGRRLDVVNDSTTVGPGPTTTLDAGPTPTTTVQAWTSEVALRAPNGLVATAIVADDDTVWVGGTRDGASVVYRLDRAGNVLSTIPLPGSLRGLAAGSDYIYAWGGGDDGSPGGIGFIDRRAGRLMGRAGWDSPITPEGQVERPLDLAVDGESAWLTDTALGELLNVRPQPPGGGGIAHFPVGEGVTDVVVLADGEVWVRDEHAPGTIGRIDRTTGAVVDRQSWSGPLFAGDGGAVWTTDGDRLVALTPSLLAEGLSVALGPRIDGPGPDVVDVLVDDAGIWVQEAGALCRFERTTEGELTLAAGLTTTVDAIAVDGDGLLIVDGRTNAVRRWHPA